MADLDDRICAWCGLAYTPTNENQIYCKPTHAERARVQRRRSDRNFHEVTKILAEQFHGRDTGQARRWFNTRRRDIRQRPPARSELIAEARATIPAPRLPIQAAGDAMTARLLELRARLAVLYSFQTCPDCLHPGWAHARWCQSHCDCERRLPQRAA